VRRDEEWRLDKKEVGEIFGRDILRYHEEELVWNVEEYHVLHSRHASN
jgi:hypothetical protein